MSNPLIIIEGPDNVGKTTLINNIINHFNNITFQSLHFSNVKHSSIEEGIAYIAQTARSISRHLG